MKKLMFLAMLFLVLALPLANATVTEVTAEASASSVTTGTSIIITSTVTASEQESTSLQLITSPSGITISDPPGGSYSSLTVSTTPTTKTFTVSAGSADTYSYFAQAGTTQSTSKSLVFVDPSVLTVAGSPSSTTKNAGGSFTLSIDITNSQSSDITTSYSLSCPSGITCTGDPTSSSSTTVNSGSTKNLQWTAILSSSISSGDYSITFQLGDNDNAFSTTVTVPAAEEETSTNGGTTTGGTVTGGGPIAEKAKNATKKHKLVPGIGLKNNTKLQAAIEKVLAKGKLNQKAIDNLMRLSESITSNLSFTRDFKIENGKSKLTGKMKYNGKKKVRNFMIYDKVPKDFARYSDNITVTTTAAVEVVETDPSFIFKYDEVSPGEELTWTYETSGEKDASVINKTSTEVYVESLEQQKVTEKKCPTCPECTDWSLCVNGTQTRTCYNCSAQTNYECQSYEEKKACVPEKPPAKFPWLWVGIILLIAAVGFVYYFKFYEKKTGYSYQPSQT